MARKKTQIDRAELEAAIAKVEGGKRPPNNLTALYKAVADYLGPPASPGSVKGRIEDYGLSINTKPGRTFSASGTGFTTPPILQGDGESATVDFTPFTRRGIEVRTLSDMFTSPFRSDEENLAIMDAIREIREADGIPFLSREEFAKLQQKRRERG